MQTVLSKAVRKLSRRWKISHVRSRSRRSRSSSLLVGRKGNPANRARASRVRVINKVKVIKRRAYGIPTFTAFRRRVLLACG